MLLQIAVLSSCIALSLGATCSVAGSYDTANSNYIVNAHNNFRSEMARGVYKAANGTQTAPAAKNMQMMFWSCALQQTAQSWANQRTDCALVHSNTGGENLYSAGTTGTLTVNGTGIAASKLWSDEFVKYGLNNLQFSYQVGHATQMAWWNTNQIGCGYKTCVVTQNNVKWNKIIVVCQYRANGNVGSQQAYAPGTSCSACGTGFKCETTTKLCIAA